MTIDIAIRSESESQNQRFTLDDLSKQTVDSFATARPVDDLPILTAVIDAEHQTQLEKTRQGESLTAHLQKFDATSFGGFVLAG